MIPYIDKQIVEWFYWAERQVSGGLGFRDSFDMKEAGQGKPGPIHPERLPPAYLRPIDEAIREIDGKHWTTLVWRYGQKGTIKDQAESLYISPTLYKQRIHAAQCWIAGYLRSIEKVGDCQDK